MCSMMRAGYAMLLSEYLWLELFLMMKLTLDFTDFQAHRTETADATRRTLKEGIRSLELENG